MLCCLIFIMVFDVVSYTALIDKPRLLGEGDLLLNSISDFLTGRIIVTASAACSSSTLVQGLLYSGLPLARSRVLRGSALSPLLFLVHVNHLPSYIRTNCKRPNKIKP